MGREEAGMNAKTERRIGSTSESPTAAQLGSLDSLVGDAVKLGDWRLIEDRFPGKVIAIHENGSIRVRLEDGREMDGWPERTKAIPNDKVRV